MAVWIRMRDPQTKHHFDVPERRVEALVADGLEVVDGYPKHVGPNARPGKPHQQLQAEAEAADRRRPRAATPATDEGPAAEPAKTTKRSEKS